MNLYYGRTIILKICPPGSLERKAVEEEIGKVRSKKKEKERMTNDKFPMTKND